MATDLASFRIRFPEFSDAVEYPDARVQLFLDDAQIEIGTNESRWGIRYNIAHAYLAAHLLVVGTKLESGDSSPLAGVITSKSAGGVSVTKSVSAKSKSDGDEFYMSTGYGQRFIIVRSVTFAGAMAASSL